MHNRIASTTDAKSPTHTHLELAHVIVEAQLLSQLLPGGALGLR
jgi:hypothetical protein